MSSPTPALSHPQVPHFVPLFTVALIVRLGTVVLGSVLASRGPDPFTDPNTPAHFRSELLAESTRVIEPWYRFDAYWYTKIARAGYTGSTEDPAPHRAAFLPALPAVMAAGEAIGLNIFWVGLLAPNLFGAAGAALLAQVIGRQLTGPADARMALALLLSFPTAFFYSAPYNESFGLFFTALALSAWQTNRPALAGLSALGVSLARMTGAALGVAAVLDWLVHPKRSELLRAAAVLVGSFAGLALFWGFLWCVVGDPFVGLKSHAMWGRHELSLYNPWRAIESIYDPSVPRAGGATHFAGETVAVLAFTALGFRALWKRGTFWGVLVLVPIGQMFASGTLLSAHRLVLAGLPAFLELTDLLRSRRPLFVALVFIFAAVQFHLIDRYVHWQFAG